MKTNRVTLGTDPEFFLMEEDSKKKISAIPHIKGTKYEPLFLPNGSKIQHDNVALEFSTAVAKDGHDLANKIKETLMLIKKDIPKGMSMIAEASAEFAEDQLQDFEALQFGCEPDFNAWTLNVNIPPSIDTNLRSCGGHLHVGHTENSGCDFLLNDFGKIHVVRMMDTFHGIVSVVLDSSMEAHRRRELYGKAGCYRPTSYGVEYRVMSNYWLRSPKLVAFMDYLLQDALYELQAEDPSIFKDASKNATLIETIGEDTIQSVINKSNVEEAKHIIDKYLVHRFGQITKDLFKEALNSTYKTIYEEWA